MLNTPELASPLERYRETRTGREKPSRYWKLDLETLEPPAGAGAGGGTVEISSSNDRIVACDLETARREHAALVERVLWRAVHPSMKFAYLTQAFEGLGAFVYVPADCNSDDPVVVRYRAKAGEAIFPHTVVLAERGARVTIVEELDVQAGSFICGVAEVVTAESADVSYAATQFAPNDARVLFTRAALPGRASRVAWATAEMGAALTVADVAVTIDAPGVEAAISTIFFPGGTQHVDIMSTVDHRVGDSSSRTLVKSAATGSGQGRYLGNIRIAANAQNSEANLRDDALLLSKRSHIDSIPALEIAANEVKAYHGATVGAIDDEQIFYMISRGIDRESAERMIALGFFEPAIERFPGETLRERLREELARKVMQA